MRTFTFRAKDESLLLGGRTAIMGIVNVTPDSFYSQSRHPEIGGALEAARRLVGEGADIVDIGGESTRPGARPVPEAEESRRVLPVIEKLRAETKALISIDTRKAAVAKHALEAGAHIVNDVSALNDESMAGVVADAGAGLVVMHMRGTPETMQRRPVYEDVVREVRDALASTIRRAEATGVSSDRILVDPGIGFGKTVTHNLTLLDGLPALSGLGKPIVVGTSRKSFLARILGASPETSLFGTAASVACAVLRGAHVVRVHDVREMREVTLVADAIRSSTSGSRP